MTLVNKDNNNGNSNKKLIFLKNFIFLEHKEFMNNQLSNTVLGERYKLRWVIQAWMNDTGLGERYMLGWAIQAWVRDTGSGERYMLGWATQAQVSNTGSSEPLVFNIPSNSHLSVFFHRTPKKKLPIKFNFVFFLNTYI